MHSIVCILLLQERVQELSQHVDLLTRCEELANGCESELDSLALELKRALQVLAPAERESASSPAPLPQPSHCTAHLLRLEVLASCCIVQYSMRRTSPPLLPLVSVSVPVKAMERALSRLADGPLAQHQRLAEAEAEAQVERASGSDPKPSARERLLEKNRALHETRQRLLSECLDAKVLHSFVLCSCFGSRSFCVGVYCRCNVLVHVRV